MKLSIKLPESIIMLWKYNFWGIFSSKYFWPSKIVDFYLEYDNPARLICKCHSNKIVWEFAWFQRAPGLLFVMENFLMEKCHFITEKLFDFQGGTILDPVRFRVKSSIRAWKRFPSLGKQTGWANQSQWPVSGIYDDIEILFLYTFGTPWLLEKFSWL